MCAHTHVHATHVPAHGGARARAHAHVAVPVRYRAQSGPLGCGQGQVRACGATDLIAHPPLVPAHVPAHLTVNDTRVTYALKTHVAHPGLFYLRRAPNL